MYRITIFSVFLISVIFSSMVLAAPAQVSSSGTAGSVERDQLPNFESSIFGGPANHNGGVV